MSDLPECEQHRTTCPKANYKHGENAELREYDLRYMGSLITEAVESMRPLLVHKPPVVVYGKTRRQQRNVGFFAEAFYGYFYSGQRAASIPPPAAATKLLRTVNATFGLDFNAILVNEYETGADYVSSHQDSDVGKIPPENVLTISYGAERTFRVRCAKKIVADAPTRHMHALLMTGSQFQRDLHHEIPIQKKVTARRVSLTFRKHDKEYDEEQMAKLKKRQSNKRKRADEVA